MVTFDKNKASILGGFVVIVGLAFYAGVHVGEGRIPEVEKITSLINVEDDVLTAQVAVDTEKVDFTPYWRVWNTLERKFIPFGTSTAEEVDAEKRMYRSIEGLVASYNDPYTIFMQPQLAEEFKIATKGSLEGIGAVIGERDGGLIVVGPLPGSPAETAGLVAGDKIHTVDGTPVTGMVVDDAVKLIRGEGGTVVVLSIQSEGQEPRDVSITRGTIEIPSTAHTVIEREVPKIAVAPKDDEQTASVGGVDVTEPADPVEPEEPVEMEMQDFYILRLFSFSQTSIAAFERELHDFVESGSQSLIIDLRGNPGGYIESAIQIASWFLPHGSVVVREYSGPEKKEILHTSQGKELFKSGIPKVVVLVDNGSASASEILAGALQEHNVATIVGTNTFGKGSVQELISITDTLSLKVTVARWYTPNGVSISQGGLTPDVRVDPATATSSDPWLDEAVKVLSTK
jgi:carboxyl-terminal processing protease